MSTDPVRVHRGEGFYASASKAAADAGDDYDEMTKAQLLEEADAEAIEVHSQATKAEIIAALRAG